MWYTKHSRLCGVTLLSLVLDRGHKVYGVVPQPLDCRRVQRKKQNGPVSLSPLSACAILEKYQNQGVRFQITIMPILEC